MEVNEEKFDAILRPYPQIEMDLYTFRFILRLRNAIKMDIQLYKEELERIKKLNQEGEGFHYSESEYEGKIKYAKRMIDELDGRMELWAGRCTTGCLTSICLSEKL